MKAGLLVLFVCISLAAVVALTHGGEEHPRHIPRN
jgi:hypothetical protein